MYGPNFCKKGFRFYFCKPFVNSLCIDVFSPWCRYENNDIYLNLYPSPQTGTQRGFSRKHHDRWIPLPAFKSFPHLSKVFSYTHAGFGDLTTPSDKITDHSRDLPWFLHPLRFVYLFCHFYARQSFFMSEPAEYNVIIRYKYENISIFGFKRLGRMNLPLLPVALENLL